MYNRIGKRIIGVGRVEGSTGDNESARIPDSYEMPRDAIDLSFSKTFFDHLELKLNVRDLLAQKVTFFLNFCLFTFEISQKCVTLQPKFSQLRAILESKISQLRVKRHSYEKKNIPTTA